MRRRELVEMQQDNDSNRTGVSSTPINQGEENIPRISALPMHLCTFSRVGMPIIHFSIWYSLGKWRERCVIMGGRSIMVVVVC
jgi:hypothetical protein